MGLQREGGHATLEPLPGVETSAEASAQTGFQLQELCREGASLHALEGILPRAGPQSAHHLRCELRGVLLHLLQPGVGDCEWDLFPLEEREVSTKPGRRVCINTNTHAQVPTTRTEACRGSWMSWRDGISMTIDEGMT